MAHRFVFALIENAFPVLMDDAIGNMAQLFDPDCFDYHARLSEMCQ